MRFSILILSLALLSLAPTSAFAQETCGYGRRANPTFVTGYDGASWYVRSSAELFRDPFSTKSPDRIPKWVGTGSAGDMLARAAGVTIFYFDNARTQNPLPIREWRGETPLEALRSFAASAGLIVETPTSDVWLIGPPWMNEQGALRVTWRPLDPRNGLLPEKDSVLLATALLRKLPIRKASSGLSEASTIDVGYYGLPEEGRDVFLVVVAWTPLLSAQYPLRQVFKLRVDRSKTNEVECVWATKHGSIAPQGPFYPQVTEDFDGDGYRDLVFGWEGDKTENVILSGRDGSILINFAFSALAVEKRNGLGPKRVSFVRFGGREDPNNRVTLFDLDGQRSARIAEMRATAQEESPDEITDGSGDEMKKIWRRLARDVGGPEHVRLYTLDDNSGRTIKDVEVVEVRRRDLNPGSSGAPVPSEVLFEWESEGFRRMRELREAALKK